MRNIILILSLLISSITFAQEKESNLFTQKSSKALLFSFRGLDNLSAQDFDGGIGGKYFVNDQLAIRFGLQISGMKQTTPANPDTSQNGYDGKRTRSSITFSPAVEWHFNNKRISPYAGLGLKYVSSSSSRNYERVWNKDYTGNITKSIFEESGAVKLVFFILTGVEVFIIQGISLTAEYLFEYETIEGGKTKETQTRVQGDATGYPKTKIYKAPDASSYSFRSGGYLTLSVYF